MQYIISKSKYPKEIISFLDNVFEIYEIRGRMVIIMALNLKLKQMKLVTIYHMFTLNMENSTFQ